MTNRIVKFPIDLTLRAIGGRWKCAIICHLLDQERRTSELMRILSPVSAKVLAEQLRELEADGLVEKRAEQGRSLAVYYSLTPRGQTLRPIIDLMCEWGRLHLAVSNQSTGGARFQGLVGVED